ncbi:hypothetical protein ACEN9X_00480 [Mucilaginibacter sp. Mucisp86]
MKLTFATKKRNNPDDNSDYHDNSYDTGDSPCFKYSGDNGTAA